jgi:site-specific recombinase
MRIHTGKKRSLNQIITSFSNKNSNEEEVIDNLVELIDHFRPRKPYDADIISIRSLIDLLKSQPQLQVSFSSVVSDLLKGKRFTSILADAGILRDNQFLKEVKHRIVSRILPEQPEKDTLEYIFNQVFYKETDVIWIARIPQEEIYELTHIIGLNSIYTSLDENSPLTEILNAITLIIQRVSGRALEADILRMIPEYENVRSPFEAFEQEFDLLEDKIRSSPFRSVNSNDENYIRLVALMDECYVFVERAYENSKTMGISMKVNQSLLRIRQQLDRISVLIPLLSVDIEENKNENSLRLTYQLIKYNCYKNNIRRLIEDSTSTIAFEITKHTAKTGEHYITNDSSEYFKMFKAAFGGGIVVGILCIIKLLLSKTDSSDFGYAFLYSMNYSLGFIAIYLLGFTLATKQPAMTASAIVEAIDKGKQSEADEQMQHAAFAELFARLFRSQFIAFIGNVVAALPVALAGTYLIDTFYDYNIAEAKWPKMIDDINPLVSKAIFHAGIAGVFLFLSGVISGSISNRHKFDRIEHRITEHPFLKRNLGKARTKKLAAWVAKKWPAVASNFWFGIFMGSTASIGIFIGLDLDIRHITFASGNLGLSLYGSGFELTADMIFWSIIGIGVIGFMNFIVSFMLSLTLAMRSRKIPFSEIRYLFASVWWYFKINPQRFFYPEKK